MDKILQSGITIKGGRDGELKEDNNAFSFDLKTPKEMGGDGQNAPNPEALFGAAYASCFAASLEYLLKAEKVAGGDIKLHTLVNLVPDPNGGFKFELEVEVAIQGVDQTTQETFIKTAKQFCPVSKAIVNNVDITFI